MLGVDRCVVCGRLWYESIVHTGMLEGYIGLCCEKLVCCGVLQSFIYSVCLCVCVCAYVRACMRACVRIQLDRF